MHLVLEILGVLFLLRLAFTIRLHAVNVYVCFIVRITRFQWFGTFSFLDSGSLTRWQQILRTLCILPASSGRISYAL